MRKRSCNRDYRNGIKVIRAMLWEWSEYVLEPVVGLGYPTRTVEGRIGIDKEDASPVKNSKPMQPRYNGNKRASATDAAISNLTKAQKEVVYAEFVENKPTKKILSEMGISPRKYSYIMSEVFDQLATELGVSMG